VHEAAAGINDVRHVAFALVLARRDQRLAQAAEDPGRVVAIEVEEVRRAPLGREILRFDLEVDEVRFGVT